MPLCRSGAGCSERAVMPPPPAPRPLWCQQHGDQLARIAREFNSRKRDTTAVKPKPPPERRGPPKLPVEVRMMRIVEHVAANGPVTRSEAAKIAGLTSTDGSLVRIIKRARQLGLLQTRRGPEGGLKAGPALAERQGANA